MKKITLVLAMMGLSTIALAGAPGNNMVAPTGTPVIAPDSTGMWSVGLEALYMEDNTNFQYASEIGATTAGVATEVDNESVTNNWGWGGEVDLSYMFPGSSRDVSASYTYLNLDNNNNSSEAGAIGGVSPMTAATISSASAPFDAATGETDTILNGATLTFGQLLTVGDRLSLHPFGGVQFADINNTNTANYFNTDATTGALVETGNYQNSSDFTGAGPRAGIDASVHLGSGFSIVGTAAGALLVGNMSSSFVYGGPLASGVTGGAGVDFDNDSYTAIVPELDAKLGVNYMYAFNPNTSMNLEVGYQVVDYFNAEVADALDSVTTNSVNNTSDFSYNGPYLRLQLNVA